MKTSFYLVLWIVLIFGMAFLGINDSFFITLALVVIISWGLTSLLRSQIIKANTRSMLQTFNLIYTGNLKKYREQALQDFIFSAATFVYLALATIGFLALPKGSYSIAELGIFAIIAVLNGANTLKAYRHWANAQVEMQTAREHPSEAYAHFYSLRAKAPFEALLPQLDSADRRLRLANIICSILAIIFGLGIFGFYGFASLAYGINSLWDLITVAYGGITLMYGINDLITLIRS